MKRVRDIDWTDPRLIRSGIIPYTSIHNTILLGLPVETGIASLSDFGGHIEESDGDALNAALREYSEESYDVFGPLTRNSIADCYVLEGPTTNEILLPVPPLPLDYSQEFRRLASLDEKAEADDIAWLTLNQVQLLYTESTLAVNGIKLWLSYSPVTDTLRQYDLDTLLSGE